MRTMLIVNVFKAQDIKFVLSKTTNNNKQQRRIHNFDRKEVQNNKNYINKNK